MKKIIICLGLLVGGLLNISGQGISLKTVSLKHSDLSASTNPRTDSNGKTCAIVKVDVIGVKDLQFIDAVGNVDYSLGEYVVYIPEGLKELNYKNASGSISGVVNFDDYGLEVETKRVYNVVFESDNHTRAAIFSIQPQNAKLVFDGEEVALDENGLAAIEKPIGQYHYSVQAKGYEERNGTVDLSEDDIFTTTNVNLKQKMYPLKITSTPPDASLYIDDTPWGKLNTVNNLTVPEGNHVIRLTAIGYRDFEQSVNVESMLELTASLQQMKEETIQYSDERTRTSINIRNSYYLVGSFSFAGITDVSKIFGNKQALDFGLEFSAVQHFAGILAIREGVSFSVLKPNDNDTYFDLSVYKDSTRYFAHIDVPLQLGISIPFGAYNQHLFSIFAGGYGSFLWRVNSWRERVLSEEEMKKDIPNSDEEYWSNVDYGIRVSSKIDIGHFSLGIDLSQSFHKFGFSVGANLGYKFYSFKKGKKG